MPAESSTPEPPSLAGFDFWTLWNRHVMAVDKVTQRMARFTVAMQEGHVPYSVIGGQAVALWVASRDEAAVRTTKDVDVLLRREDLGKARAAARTIGFDYQEIVGVGMFLDPDSPNPKHAVHIVWAGEFTRPGYPLPAPTIEASLEFPNGIRVVSLPGLIAMKLMANRDHDRAHLRDMADVGLLSKEMLIDLPVELAERLRPFLDESGR